MKGGRVSLPITPFRLWFFLHFFLTASPLALFSFFLSFLYLSNNLTSDGLRMPANCIAGIIPKRNSQKRGRSAQTNREQVTARAVRRLSAGPQRQYVVWKTRAARQLTAATGECRVSRSTVRTSLSPSLSLSLSLSLSALVHSACFRCWCVCGCFASAAPNSLLSMRAPTESLESDSYAASDSRFH
jgi:hypothetical protein